MPCPQSIIVRADDCGLNASTNAGILDVYRSGTGLMKNVSLMANGAAIEEAARLFAEVEDLCFGVHLTLNSEWTHVRWGPITPSEAIRSLVDSEGYFHRSPLAFRHTDIMLDEVFLEMDNQLETLVRLGFRISYADEHMFFGDAIDGFADRFDAWCRQHGLIPFRWIHHPLPKGSVAEEAGDPLEHLIARIDNADSNIVTWITHPARDTEEMRGLGRTLQHGESIARGRDMDRRLLMDPRLKHEWETRHIQVLRYDEL